MKHRLPQSSIFYALILGIAVARCGFDPALHTSNTPLQKRAVGAVKVSGSAIRFNVLEDNAPSQRAVEVRISRTISGRALNFQWSDDILQGKGLILMQGSDSQRGVTGYYLAEAIDPFGGILGRWGSIPINNETEVTLTLPLNAKASHIRAPIAELANATFEIITIDNDSLSQLNPGSVEWPKEIQLLGYHPLRLIDGVVTLSKLGPKEIVSFEPGRMLLLVDGELGNVEAVVFGDVIASQDSISGWFGLAGPLINSPVRPFFGVRK